MVAVVVVARVVTVVVAAVVVEGVEQEWRMVADVAA